MTTNTITITEKLEGIATLYVHACERGEGRVKIDQILEDARLVAPVAWHKGLGSRLERIHAAAEIRRQQRREANSADLALRAAPLINALIDVAESLQQRMDTGAIAEELRRSMESEYPQISASDRSAIVAIAIDRLAEVDS